MDDLDTAGTLAFIDTEIAKAEQECRKRIELHPDDAGYAAAQWRIFHASVAILRQNRDLLVTAAARVKSFEAPSRIILTSNPQR